MSSLQIRIYFEDTDAQGLVYNSNYLKYLERGRTEFLRNFGYDQKKILDANVKCGCLEIKNKKPFKIPNGLYQSMKENIDGI